MANKETGKILVVLGFCCVIAAAAFYMYSQWISNQAASASEELTDTLLSLLEESETTAPDNVTDSLLGNSGAVAESSNPEESEASHQTVNVSGYDITGIISIPAININLAVNAEWSYPKLKVSACRYSGEPSGQFVILAHNFKRHFGRINELRPGDTVVFTEPDGTVYNYEVTGTEIRGKYELKDIQSGDWDLTLFTCTYGGENRVVVRCKRTD